MASNPINVNSQMQKLADNAVNTARDKFGVSLDFSENSLQQLEMLLQQSHEGSSVILPLTWYNTMPKWMTRTYYKLTSNTAR